MPRRNQTPSYRLHKARGLGFVEIDGRRTYLGKHGTAESLERYHRLIAERLAGKPSSPSLNPSTSGATVGELVLAFWTWAKARYVKHGQPTTEVRAFRTALNPAVQLYGSSPAASFGPLALIACRNELVAKRYCRKKINTHVGRIRRCWKWGVSREMVPVTAWQALLSVEGLRKGQTSAPERPPVKPVLEEHVAAIRPFLTPHLAAMVDLQLLTGMRPGEVCDMRTIDISMSGETWEYRPHTFKTEHHEGSERIVYLGPQAQKLVRDWLRTEVEAYLFQPRESRAWHLAQRRAARKTKMTPSQRARKRKAKPKRQPGERYTALSYGHAIKRACKQAGVPGWSPNQLRHNAATRIRAAFGIEASRVILGHASAVTSEIYAEVDRQKAAEIVAALG